MDGKAAFHVLHLLETPRIGIAKVYAILDMANSYAMSLSDFLYKPFSLKEVLNDSQIDAFLALEDKTRQIWDDLEEKGVQLVPVTDDNYPERLRTLLGKKAPPLLMVMGNRHLLGKPSVGFCGSRKASEKGIVTAKDCADQLASEGVNIISGYAAGVDLTTHQAALECGGTTTLVLCEGILNFRIKRDLNNFWDWERIAVISEFLPGLPWSAHNAMQRNRTICALSAAMILIEAGSTGGSIEAGRTCLRMGVPLFAPVYEGMPESAVGNRELLQQGAYSLLKNRRTGRANMGTMLSVIKGKVPDSRKENDYHEIETLETDQLSLFDSGEDYSPKNKRKRQES